MKSKNNAIFIVILLTSWVPATISKLTTSDAKRMWVAVGDGTVCDTSAGEVYRKESPGRLPNIEACKKSCEGDAGCQSITYFIKSGWCSHFSTTCTKGRKGKATSMKLVAASAAKTTPGTVRHFTRGQRGSNACPTGYFRITDFKTCAEASAALLDPAPHDKKTFYHMRLEHFNNPTYPSGCMYFHDHRGSVLNNAKGKGSMNAYLICADKYTPPGTTAEPKLPVIVYKNDRTCGGRNVHPLSGVANEYTYREDHSLEQCFKHCASTPGCSRFGYWAGGCRVSSKICTEEYLPGAKIYQLKPDIPTATIAAGSWIKTKGACRYSDGSFHSFASTKVTNHGECRDFCIKHSKCDAFDTDGDECFLFQHKDGKKHTGDGEGADFCYIRVATTQATTTTSSTAAKLSCSSIVTNGGFEKGWRSPWIYVYAGKPGLPGWTVTHGSVDFGDYKTRDHCDKKPCAHGGKSLLDMCGGSSGAIAQTLKTVPNTVYVLKLAYDAHATCTGKGTVMEMDVIIDGKTVKRLKHKNEYTWDLDWDDFSYEFKASGNAATLEFKSVNSGCGCMVLDDVTVRPKHCASTATSTSTTVTEITSPITTTTATTTTATVATRTTTTDTTTTSASSTTTATTTASTTTTATTTTATVATRTTTTPSTTPTPTPTTTVTTTTTTTSASSTTTATTTASTTTTAVTVATRTTTTSSTSTTTTTTITTATTTTASITATVRTSTTTTVTLTTTAAQYWIKTKGVCRFSDGSFDIFASKKVTNHDACKQFCIENARCDAFATDASACFLFEDKAGKMYTGNGRGAKFCYVRSPSSTTGTATATSATATTTSSTTTAATTTTTTTSTSSTSHVIIADSWIKTKGACRYSDGSFNAFASIKATNHNECRDFCIKNSKCDAFDTDGSKCFLFQHKDGKMHTGDGEGPAFCYIRGSSEDVLGAWIKTRGVCRYSDGSFNAFASTKVTNHDECRDFCIKNLKCDAFDTDSSECFLFQHNDGKKHTGDGEGPAFCYIRAATTSTTATVSGNDNSGVAESNSAAGGDLDVTSVPSVAIVFIVTTVVCAAAVVVIVVVVKKRKSITANDPDTIFGGMEVNEISLGNGVMHALPVDDTNTSIAIMVKEKNSENYM